MDAMVSLTAFTTSGDTEYASMYLESNCCEATVVQANCGRLPTFPLPPVAMLPPPAVLPVFPLPRPPFLAFSKASWTVWEWPHAAAIHAMARAEVIAEGLKGKDRLMNGTPSGDDIHQS